MKKLFALIIGILFVFTVYSASPMAAMGGNPAGPAAGMTLGSFNTTDLEGNAVDSSILGETKLTVINYWATWCPPCIMEMPDFSRLYKHFTETPEADVRLIGVISEGGGCTPGSAKQYLDENGYEWLNLRSCEQLDKLFYTSNSIPQTLVLDQNGRVLSHRIGAFSNYDELLSYVNGYLTASEASEADTQTAKPKASSCGGF